MKLKSSERRMKLILMLQQSNKRLTVAQLAEKFEVSERTIYRDFNALSELNVPVTWDKYQGYGIMKGYSVPPLMFTSKELATIMVGLDFAKSQINKTLAEDAKGVALKIKEVLPNELTEFMESLEEHTVVDPFLRFGPDKMEGGNWYTISSAISQRNTIKFTYRSRRDAEARKRTVDPYLIVFYQDHWNMIGYSHKREAIRNFVLSKVDDIDVSDNHYVIPLNTETEDLIFRSNEAAHFIEVEVDQKELQRFEANLPAKIKRKKRISAEQFEIQFLFDNLNFINKWLLQFPLSVKILAPRVLENKRKELLNKMAHN